MTHWRLRCSRKEPFALRSQSRIAPRTCSYIAQRTTDKLCNSPRFASQVARRGSPKPRRDWSRTCSCGSMRHRQLSWESDRSRFRGSTWTPRIMGPDWLISSWRTFWLELRRLAPRSYGSECGSEIQEPWPSIESGVLTSWGSISSSLATIRSVTCSCVAMCNRQWGSQAELRDPPLRVVVRLAGRKGAGMDHRAARGREVDTRLQLRSRRRGFRGPGPDAPHECADRGRAAQCASQRGYSGTLYSGRKCFRRR